MQVYKASLRGWPEPVAVKRVEFDKGGARDVQSCLRELGLLSTLRSPYIVKFLGGYADSTGISIVLEVSCLLLTRSDAALTCRRNCITCACSPGTSLWRGSTEISCMSSLRPNARL